MMIGSGIPVRLLAVVLVMSSVMGCRAIEGDFSPGCAVYAGDRVSLHDGRFSWDRFTDARRVDTDGQPVDPFPDFPKTGSYTLSGNRVDLESGGEVIASWYLHEDGDRLLLLSADQQAAWEASGQYPECPLVPRGGD